METTSSRPLAVESFSDSWLSNARPSLIDIIEDDVEETTTTTTLTNSFDFDTPNIIQSSQPYSHHINHVHVVHADEIFSNGLIKPIFHPTTITSAVGSSYAVSSSPVIFDDQPRNRARRESGDHHVQTTGCSCCLIRRRGRFLQRLFGYLNIGKTRRCGGNKTKKSSTKVDDIDRRTMEIKSLNDSPQTSPISPSTYYDIESSIQEAVLHCKRSIGR